MLKDGVKVTYRDAMGIETAETVRLMDWENPANNDFFLASQFWVSGDMYKRRPDLLGFVNGIPLLFIELKAAHVNLENAYKDNLRDYKDTIPQLFWYNAFILLSNGSDAQDRQHHRRLGAFQRVEEDQQRRRRRRRLAGNRAPRHLRASPLAGYR